MHQCAHDARMQVIAVAERLSARPGRLSLVRGAVVAMLLLASGIAAGWFLLATPILEDFMIAGPRPTPSQAVAGVVAGALAILIPAGFLLLGVAQAVATVERFVAARPRPHLHRLARDLGDEYLVVTGLRLPDGRRIPELVLGPFGLAVLAEAPNFAGIRRVGGRWEARDRRGRWTSVESPEDRTLRDTERVRRWLGAHERDFVVKVYAAIVSAEPGIARTPGCTVVAPSNVATWIGSLPPQRGLTAARRADLHSLIREAAGTA